MTLTIEEHKKQLNQFEVDRLLKLLKIEADKNFDNHYCIEYLGDKFSSSLGLVRGQDTVLFSIYLETFNIKTGFDKLKDSIIHTLITYPELFRINDFNDKTRQIIAFPYLLEWFYRFLKEKNIINNAELESPGFPSLKDDLLSVKYKLALMYRDYLDYFNNKPAILELECMPASYADNFNIFAYQYEKFLPLLINLCCIGRLPIVVVKRNNETYLEGLKHHPKVYKDWLKNKESI